MNRLEDYTWPKISFLFLNKYLISFSSWSRGSPVAGGVLQWPAVSRMKQRCLWSAYSCLIHNCSVLRQCAGTVLHHFVLQSGCICFRFIQKRPWSWSCLLMKRDVATCLLCCPRPFRLAYLCLDGSLLLYFRVFLYWRKTQHCWTKRWQETYRIKALFSWEKGTYIACLFRERICHWERQKER